MNKVNISLSKEIENSISFNIQNDEIHFQTDHSNSSITFENYMELEQLNFSRYVKKIEIYDSSNKFFNFNIIKKYVNHCKDIELIGKENMIYFKCMKENYGNIESLSIGNMYKDEDFIFDNLKYFKNLKTLKLRFSTKYSIPYSKKLLSFCNKCDINEIVIYNIQKEDIGELLKNTIINFSIF